MSETRPKPHRFHDGQQGGIRVGMFNVIPAGLRYLQHIAPWPADVIVWLTKESLPDQAWGKRIILLTMKSLGAVPDDWVQRVQEVSTFLMSGKQVMVVCDGGHGRTGTMLASLIALMESAEETPDPIAAVRARHCVQAVESMGQAEAVFAMRQIPIPLSYRQSLFATQ